MKVPSVGEASIFDWTFRHANVYYGRFYVLENLGWLWKLKIVKLIEGK